MVSFAVQKPLSLIRSQWFVFVFVFIFFKFRRLIQKDTGVIYVRVFSLCFLLSFIVCGLTFSSLIHFEFIIIMTIISDNILTSYVAHKTTALRIHGILSWMKINIM